MERRQFLASSTLAALPFAAPGRRGAQVNGTRGDMHEGTRRLVAELRHRFPRVLACGEFQYDALLELFPIFERAGI